MAANAQSNTQDEHAQLLDDSHASYGVFTDQNNSVTNDADAAVVQQENEELRGIVGATSRYLHINSTST